MIGLDRDKEITLMYLHLGSGRECKSKPWVNIDFAYPFNIPEGCEYIEHDLRQGLPEGIKEVVKVYSSHFFEHLSYQTALNLMEDCRRRMIPGAIFRMCVPDFAKTVKAYIENDTSFFAAIAYSSPRNRLHEYLLYSLYGEGHQCIYDGRFAVETLELVGFKNVRIVPYDRTIDPDCDIREHFSVVVEGIN